MITEGYLRYYYLRQQVWFLKVGTGALNYSLYLLQVLTITGFLFR